jgi:alginate O-acetyltransferase complex protein AlgI
LITGYFLKIFVADNLSEQTAFLTLGPEIPGRRKPLEPDSLALCYTLRSSPTSQATHSSRSAWRRCSATASPVNFNFPYLSTSITEFWKRWHMSLSGWLRDYLYIPLGGNRKGEGRTYVNLFLVMFLGGLWHGAEWKFAVWGSLHGIFLALERLGSGIRGQRSESRDQKAEISAPPSVLRPPSSVLRSLSSIVRWFITFHLVTLLWLTFLMPDMASILAFFKGVFSGRSRILGSTQSSRCSFMARRWYYITAWGWLNEHRRTFR